MPRDFCFVTDSPQFKHASNELGLSERQLNFYASIYADTFGLTADQMKEAVWGDKRTKNYNDFREWIENRPASTRGFNGGLNLYADRQQLKRAEKIWKYYNGRRLDTISHGEYLLLLNLLPQHEVYYDINGEKRIVFVEPRLVSESSKMFREFSERKSNPYVSVLVGGRPMTVYELASQVPFGKEAVDSLMDAYGIDYSNDVLSTAFSGLVEGDNEMAAIIQDMVDESGGLCLNTLLERYVSKKLSDFAQRKVSQSEFEEMSAIFAMNESQAEQYDYKVDALSAKNLDSPMRQAGRTYAGSDVYIYPNTGALFELTAHDKNHINKILSVGVSNLLDRLTGKNGAQEAARLFPGETFDGITDMTSRAQWLQYCGIERLLGVVRRQYMDNNPGMDFTAAIKWAMFSDDNVWRQNIIGAMHYFHENENISFDELQSAFKLSDQEISTVMLQYALSHSDEEMYSDRNHHISTISGLPADIRRFFNTIFVKDRDGNYVADPEGYGVPAVVEGRSLLRFMYDNMMDITTIEELKERIRKNIGVKGMADLLEKMESDNMFANRVFSCMNKVRLSFGINTVVTDENGVTRIVTRDLAVNQVSESLYDTIRFQYLLGRNALFSTAQTGDRVVGRGFTNTEAYTYLMSCIADANGAIAYLDSDSEEHTPEKDYDAQSSLEQSLTDALNILGFTDVTIDTVRMATYADYQQAESVTELPAYSLLQNIITVAEAFNETGEYAMPFMDMDESAPVQNSLVPSVALKQLCDSLAPYLEDVAEQFVNRDGSGWYTVGMPTALTDLAKHLDPRNRERMMDFLHENFERYRFHCLWGNIDSLSDVNWLRTCQNVPFEVKQYIDTEHVRYRDYSRPEMAVNMLSMYKQGGTGQNSRAFYSIIFGDRDGCYGIQGPKYALETFEWKGRTVRGSMKLAEGLRELGFSELLRMKSVFQKAGEFYDPATGKADKSKMAGSFDNVSDTIAKKSYYQGSGRLERSDLVDKDGRMTTSESGLSFRFLEELNNEIINDTELGREFLAFINNEEIDELSLNDHLMDAVIDNMEKTVESELDKLREIGLFDSVSASESSSGLFELRYLDCLIDESPEETLQRVGNNMDAFASERIRLAEEFMREFIWNDYFARSQIYKMTLSDLAYFPTIEKAIQYAKNLTSPGRKMNPSARDRKGVRYSADGKMRTVYISDDIVRSEIQPNIEHLYEYALSEIDKELRINGRINPSLSEERQAYLIESEKTYKKMLQDVKSGYSKFNATDGQSYSSIMGTRKKLGCLGEWNDHFEDQFDKVRDKLSKGERVSFDDLDMMIQVIKPITFSFEDRLYESGTMDHAKQLSIYKTSEIMLARAGAMLSGDGGVLMALNDIMNDSAFTDGKYNGAGIDTVIVQSGVKAGASDVVRLSSGMSHDEAYNALHDALYNSDGTYTSAVHETPLEAYTFQQENPAHLEDHYQQMGSQMRALAMSDIDESLPVEVGGVTKTAGEWKKEYYQTLADNIQSSFDDLADAFGLPDSKDWKKWNESGRNESMRPKSSLAERNRKISRILQKSLLMERTFDADLYWACGVDANGNFNVPMNDIMLGQKIMNLVNSIVRNKINKQRMPGGPVVQMSGSFYSEDLSVRFKDSSGNLLETFRQYCDRKGAKGLSFDVESLSESDRKKIESLSESYKKEVLKGKPRLAYFEVRLNIPTREMKEALTKPDGTLMTPEEAIKAGIIDEEALKVIAERIPTEDKYSIIPMRIVGFNNDVSGELITMPKEITLLTGSDFDVDKMFCNLKELRSVLTIKDDRLDAFAQRYVDEVFDPDSEASEEQRSLEKELVKKELKRLVDLNGRDLDRTSSSRPQLALFFDENKDDFCSVRFEANTDMKTEGGRMNHAFDIMMGMITSEGSVDKLFNPGGFENIKKISNVVRIMQLDGYKANIRKYGTYSELMSKSVDELKAILDREERLHPLKFTTMLHFQQENVAAKKMIGHAANNNSAHAFMQDGHMKTRLSSKTNFYFGGRSANGIEIDPVHGIDGGYVSKTLGSVCAAAVDAPKYQTLKAMNLNEFTSNAFFLLLRMGYDENIVSLFMNLPSVREMSETYAKMKNSGANVRAEDIAQMYVRDHAREYGSDRTVPNLYFMQGSRMASDYMARVTGSSGSDISGLKFTLDDLLKVYEKPGSADARFVNAMAVDTFVRMSKLGDQLFKFTHYTKLNSLNESIGSTLGSAVSTYMQINRLIEDYAPRYENGKAVYDKSHLFDQESAWNFLMGNPVIRLFYETVYSEGGSTANLSQIQEGIAKQLFGDNTVYYTQPFRQALDCFISYKKGMVTPEEVDDFANAYTQYILFQNNGDGQNSVFSLTPERMDYFTSLHGGFISRAYQMRSANMNKAEAAKNLLLKYMYVEAPSDACPVATVNVRIGECGQERLQDLRSAMLELYNSDEEFVDEAGNTFTSKEFATDLFAYAVIRDGIFGKEDSMLNIVPAQMKHDVKEYYNGLSKSAGYDTEGNFSLAPESFAIIYMRNRTDDRRIVPSLNVSGEKIRTDDYGSAGTVYELDPNDASPLIIKGVGTGKNYRVRYAKVALINGETCINISDQELSPRYMVSSPLGVPGYFTEISPEIDCYDDSFFGRKRQEYEEGVQDSEFEVFSDKAYSSSRKHGSEDSMAHAAAEWYDLGGVVNDADMTRGEILALSQIVRGDEALLSQLAGEPDSRRQRKIINKHIKERGVEISKADRKLLDTLMDKFC